MPDVEAFMGLAQLALALAGFTGIALAVATGQHEFRQSDKSLVSFVVVNSLVAAGLAVLPVVGGLLEAPAGAIWRTSSAIHASMALLGFLGPLFGRGALLSPPALLWSMRVGLMAVFVLQLLNATGWLFPPSGGVYFFAVFVVLPGTSFAFARLLGDFLDRRAP